MNSRLLRCRAVSGCFRVVFACIGAEICIWVDLLKNKSRPEAAASEAAQWVISERELRERLKREKEEKERQERIEV